MNAIRFFALAIAAGCFAISGCSDSSSTKKDDTDTTTTENGGEDHGHSHDDDHGHDHGDGAESDDHSNDAHGPNNGHPLKFEDADFGAEWLHYKGNNVIRIIFLDKKCTKNQLVKADSVTIKRASGDDEVFTLEAEDVNEEGLTDKFSVDNADLVIAMNLGVTVEVKMGDKVYTSMIPPHKPHDH